MNLVKTQLSVVQYCTNEGPLVVYTSHNQSLDKRGDKSFTLLSIIRADR